MSSIVEKHNVSSSKGLLLVMSYEEGGPISKPRVGHLTIVLLDRVKRLTQTSSISATVLDDGRLTDSKGRTVDFRAVLIMTSTSVSSLLLEGVEDDGSINQGSSQVRQLLRQHFKPEFSTES